MAMLSNFDLVRRIGLFASLPDAAVRALADALIKQRFKRHDVVVEQGSRTNMLFIMLDGLARVSMSSSRGSEIILATLRPGDYFGEMSLIDGGPHSASVRAQLQTNVLMLPRPEFSRCLAEHAGLARATLVRLAERLRAAIHRIKALALLSVHDRVVRTLTDIAMENLDGQWLIPEKVSHQDLAKMVGTSREMVSRVMKELTRTGFVEKQGGGLIRIHKDL